MIKSQVYKISKQALPFLDSTQIQKKSISSPFSDLQHFKQMLSAEDSGFFLHPYSAKKKSVWFYRLIFALLGSIFLGLAYFSACRLPYHDLLSLIINTHAIQGILTLTSVVIGLICFGVSATLKPEIEALNHLYHHAKRRLIRTYAGRKAQVSIKKFLPFSDCYRSTISLKHSYHDALEKIEHQREELKFLLKKISYAALISSSLKETLFNQALMEFRLKAETIIRSFDP